MFLRFLAFSAIACASIQPAAAQHRPHARIESGRLAGAAEAGTLAFRGIPYASAPVGPLRWRPPAPPTPWSGIRDASRYGAACPQPSDHKEPWARVGPTSEDCLFLNVWRPERPGKYPVMVFLHGGGFTYGSAGVPLYEGARLALRGVVLVTLNYRLGRLGFFAHPALTRETPDGELGNYGIMDQIAALRWVRRNIASFGGDRANVTVFGESAGAAVVQLLMASPGAAGLFHKAISQSGAGGAVLAPIRDASVSAEILGERWAEGHGLADPGVDHLRALPVDRILGRSFPFIDGRVVVASPGAAFSRAKEAKIPFLIGANSNEASLINNNETAARRLLGTAYDELLEAYAAARPGQPLKAAAADLAEDALSILPSLSLAAMHAANGAPAYDYYFAQRPSNLRAGSAGAPHGGELEYLFGNPDAGSAWDDADRAVSEAMAAHWVRFARTGKPNSAGKSVWPRVTADGALPYLVIGTPMEPRRLSALEQRVRTISLKASKLGWASER